MSESVLSVKLWICAVGQSVSLSSCGSVVSVRLLVCAVGKAVGICCRSKCGFML